MYQNAVRHTAKTVVHSGLAIWTGTVPAELRVYKLFLGRSEFSLFIFSEKNFTSHIFELCSVKINVLDVKL